MLSSASTDSLCEAKEQSYPLTNMNVVHQRKITKGPIYNDFEQSEGEASLVLSLSDLLKTFHSSFCRSSKQSEFSPKRIVEKVFNKRMDSTAQWFYMSVLGGQKLDLVSGLAKFDEVSVYLLLVLAYIGQTFYQELYNPIDLPLNHCVVKTWQFSFSFQQKTVNILANFFSSCCLLLSYWYIYSPRKPIIDLITPIFFSGTVFL